MRITLWHKEFGTVYMLNSWTNSFSQIQYGAFETATYQNFVCLPLSEVAVIVGRGDNEE